MQRSKKKTTYYEKILLKGILLNQQNCLLLQSAFRYDISMRQGEFSSIHPHIRHFCLSNLTGKESI